MSSFSSTALDSLAVDLPATTETDLLGANGLDVSQDDRLVVTVVNLNGSNPIDVFTVYQQGPGATAWSQVNVSLAACGASKATVITLMDVVGRVRLTATPVNHVSCDVHARGLRKDA